MKIKVKDRNNVVCVVSDLFVNNKLECKAEIYYELVPSVGYDLVNSSELQPIQLKNKTAYVGGDMLKGGSRRERTIEKEILRLMGYSVHNPLDDKEINDKSNQTEESNNGLAEKIVLKDTRGILQSDIIVIEPTNDALGTCVELGQIKGMKDLAKLIVETYNKQEIHELCNNILNKKIYTHYEDIRRTDIPECADRRSWSVNQYVYGVCLDLTNGKGFYEWDEIKEELK